MYDYGREIYNTLKDILQLLQTWQNDWLEVQTTWQNFFQGLFDNLFAVLLFIAVVLALSFVCRWFFPDARG